MTSAARAENSRLLENGTVWFTSPHQLKLNYILKSIVAHFVDDIYTIKFEIQDVNFGRSF